MAAVRGGEALYEAQLGLSEKGGPQHATALLAEIERAAGAAGGWDSVDRLAVGVGPGSFTGLRVGIATAKALAMSRDLPLRGVGSLDALALGLGEWEERHAGDAEDAAAPAESRPRLAVLDARRGEVASALYDAAGGRLRGPLLETPEQLGERLAAAGESLLCGGSGAVRFRQQLTSQDITIPDDADPAHRIAARHICALAAATPGEEEPGPVAPIYLRPPDAQRWRERDSVQAAE